VQRRVSPSAAFIVPALLLFAVADAVAIPAFARRYRVSCQLCHNVIPALNAFGDQFAANGFRFASAEAPRDTIATGDPLLTLARDLPLAVRLDLYAQAYANGRAATDFQTPYGIKLLSGGTLSKNLSYYFYTFINERGGLGGVEDALVQINDIGGEPVDLVIGQFQISDPLFKRELRVEFEDYAIYRARVGDVPLDLTYDRGLLATADVAGFSLSGIVFNGNGRGEAQPDRRFDNDPFKNYFLHVSRDVTRNLRVGAFGLTGRARTDAVRNRTNMVGLDLTAASGPLELNGQYIYREDDAPTFSPSEPSAKVQGGFAELLVRPTGSRWYGFGLYNLVTSDRPLLNVRLGGPADQTRYETYSAGVGRLERRNFRWSAEATWDPRQELWRWTLGIVTAF
jgi:hypothetical protein